MKSKRNLAAFVLFGAIAAAGATHAEIIEEIIAWVNGDIITLSDYNDEEQAILADVYRNFTGVELDRELAQAREQVLQQMIDRKILIHHAEALGLNLEEMGANFLEFFKDQQGIESEDEFQRALEAEGLTRAGVTERLLERYAPEQVIQFEVGARVAVGDREVEEFYQDHLDEFRVEGEVTLREIVLLADTDALKDARREKAVEIRASALAGEDFSDLAKQWSEAGTRENGGLLGPLPREDLSEILADVAFTLPAGEVSDVMETPYGFHIVRVESRIEDRAKTLDEIREDLRKLLENTKYAADVREFLERARKDSEWCVKPKHQNLLSTPAPATCERL